MRARLPSFGRVLRGIGRAGRKRRFFKDRWQIDRLGRPFAGRPKPGRSEYWCRKKP